MLTRKTSFSDFYVIDEKEEKRLKILALKKFMAEQQAQLA